jgi:hypothetical protein
MDTARCAPDKTFTRWFHLATNKIAAAQFFCALCSPQPSSPGVPKQHPESLNPNIIAIGSNGNQIFYMPLRFREM